MRRTDPARGGGSLEDLQAFNDERVARALARSTLPVVSGVGHEVDFTIADFVADARAPTPSGAAQLVTQDVRAWLQRLAQIQERLQALWRRREADAQQVLRALQERLQRAHPGARLAQHAQRLDELEQRRQRAWERLLLHARSRLEGVMRALHAVSPLATLERGFAIVQGDGDARAVTDVAQLRVGQRIHARLAHGRLHAEILSLEAGDPS